MAWFLFKKLKDISQNSQNRRSGEKENRIYETYKIQWWHMDIIFMQMHLIWQRQKCVHILSIIMHWHTVNVYRDDVLTVHVSICLTKKQIISIHTQHPQYCFTFITPLRFVLTLVEFHWKTRKCVASVNNNFQQTNIQNIHQKRASYDGYNNTWF